MKSSMSNPQTDGGDEVEVLIVGFGFSAMPLLRLLKESNIKYTILSEGKTIWQRIHEKEKLNFNLVSSFHASYYAEDQVEDGRLQDFFPPAREFHEYHEKIFREFKDEVVQDRVSSIENFGDHSVVQTKLRNTYRAKHVVVATGFSRPQNNTILDIDYDSIKNKTVVLNGFGDTSNMMLSKLVTNGNKVIIVSNGYIALEKDMCFQHNAPIKALDGFTLPMAGGTFGKKYLQDLAQMESHTIGVFFPKFWGRFMAMFTGPPGPDSWFGRLFFGDYFHMRFPSTYRRDLAQSIFRSPTEGGGGFPNGPVAIKYHAIDSYHLRYGYNRQVLKDSVREGHLLNDFIFFHIQGIVETWKRNTTCIDRENKTVYSINPSGTEPPSSPTMVAYDYIIDPAGKETPNIPPTYAMSSDCAMKHRYEYKYRENLYGVVPSRLKNVFLMGYTRPTTGGIANMNEMQAMLIHDLISNPEKKEEMYSTMQERLSQYNKKYSTNDEPDEENRTDHLVFFGLYTHDVAKFLGVDFPIFRKVLSSSWNPFKILWGLFWNFRYEFLSPNNSIKYRTFGKYAVKGGDEYFRKVYEFNEGQSLVLTGWCNVLLDRLMGYLCIFMLHLELSAWLMQELKDEEFSNILAYSIPLPVSFLLCKFLEDNLHLVYLLFFNVGATFFGAIKVYLQVPALVYTAVYGRWYWCFGILFFFSMTIYLLRQFHCPPYSGRYIFSDCKYRHLYAKFWDQYLEVYHEINAERKALKKRQ